MTTKAIKINVESQDFEMVEISNLEDYYKHLGNGCNTFSIPVTFDKSYDGIVCDDEGLYHNNIGGFILKNWQYAIVGNGLVVGCDIETGDTKDVKTSIEWLKENVIFLRAERVESYFRPFR